MYLDGLEIAGVGAGMVFLALVVLLIVILVLRAGFDRVEGWRGRRSLVAVSPAPGAPVLEAPGQVAPVIEAEPAKPPSDMVARAAAIAVALFLAEEEESDTGEE